MAYPRGINLAIVVLLTATIVVSAIEFDDFLVFVNAFHKR